MQLGPTKFQWVVFRFSLTFNPKVAANEEKWKGEVVPFKPRD